MGSVQRAHGVRGEIRLHSYDEASPWPKAALEARLARNDGAATVHRVLAVRGAPSSLILALEGIDTRERAQECMRAEVAVRRSALPALGEGEFYFFELEGASAESEHGAALGVMRQVVQNAGQVLGHIHGEQGRCLLPLVDANIVRFDRERHVIIVRGTDGLWEAP